MKKNPQHLIDQAISRLKSNKLIGLPTETVYGLAANALEDAAVASIYSLKDRPQFNPLIAHCASSDQAQQYVHFNNWAHKLAHAFWPGPLTLILEKKEQSGISLLATAGLDTLAIRVPAHPVAQEILKNLDFPLAAPSANPSESISPTKAEHVQRAFPDLLVLDGGPCDVGLESTIVDLTGKAPVILRPGSVTQKEIEDVLGISLQKKEDGSIKAPGQLKRHYAPSIPLRMNATHLNKGEALLSFGSHTIEGAEKEINLSPLGDLHEAACRLFSAMSELDSLLYTGIAVTEIPNHCIGIAINDRLKRAAYTNY